MSKQTRKPIQWVGSSKRDLDAMPESVKDLSGFGSAGVLEVIEDHHGDTFRAVYTVKLAGWVYVLHCFQKKSKFGVATPKSDVDLIKARLKAAKEHFEHWHSHSGAMK